MANFFGIRHLSPACACYVQEFLERTKPQLVLVEGPSDLNALAEPLCGRETVLPAAILAYTEEAPVKTVLWPFAEFSPEYQAILWAHKNQVPMQFCDLPAKTMLAFEAEKESKKEASKEEAGKEEAISQAGERENIYEKLEKKLGIKIDSFWEYNFEYNESFEDFIEGIEKYGESIRTYSENDSYNQIREAFMRKTIDEAVQKGIPDDKISVITGAFHTMGLKDKPYTDEDQKLLENLPELPVKATLMPYSYYRLSSRSGYGAGSKAPGYYEILWKNRRRCRKQDCAAEYLTSLAAYQREKGYGTSSAEVIEALRLAKVLAVLRGGTIPSLEDLRDAAVTCMGHGSFSEISMACASVEIGTKIGSLPDGVVCTSVQEDFKRQLKELKLEKYISPVVEELELDLREKLRVKSEKAAFLDLYRSFFLHRLRVLEIHFCKQLTRQQDHATWAELWSFQWKPEVEIEVVEASLKGDTILQAVKAQFQMQLMKAENLSQTAQILSDAFLCGISDVVHTAVMAVQKMAAEVVSVIDIGNTIGTLSAVVRFGGLRRLDTDPLEPLMEALFLRFCLGLCRESVCDKEASDAVISAMSKVNDACLSHEFLKEDQWILVLKELADRDEVNMRISGFGAAILTERGEFSNETLTELMNRRLSRGTPASDGAGWFEGLAMKNRRSLISRFSLWEQLAGYISELDEEEFKRALVCLRRTFSVFTPSEKADIAENIGEIAGISREGAAEFIEAPMTEEEKMTLDELDEFDFGDI